MVPTEALEQQLQDLEKHLQSENPILVDAITQYRDLDKVAREIGLLSCRESYIEKISWWPIISILGTFSSGKSSFINSLLGIEVQRTGQQAVDNQFTAITFDPEATPEDSIHAHPGTALDGDPRFPFFRISEKLEALYPGQGDRINNFLQMKVASSEMLNGRVIIDSPGFDADEQRKEILQITDHIVELSDLVFVFFDAHKAEPGVMQETFKHLMPIVKKCKDRTRFLFVLNQIDIAAHNSTLEELVGSWRAALANCNVNLDRYYLLFNEKLVSPVEDDGVWAQLVHRQEVDYEEVTRRIKVVNKDRSYRVINLLESLSNNIEQQVVPELRTSLSLWRHNVILGDMIVLSVVALGFWGYFDLQLLIEVWPFTIVFFLLTHHIIRYWVAKRIALGLKDKKYASTKKISEAFNRSTSFTRSIFLRSPKGWSVNTEKSLGAIRDARNKLVQKLNRNVSS